MDNINEESVKEYDNKQELVDNILKWLRTVQAHYSQPNNYGTYCKHEVLKDLIEEIELCGSNGEFPWEVLSDKPQKGFRGPAFDEPI